MPSRPSRLIAALLIVTATGLTLAACGRRGALEDPATVKKSTGGLIPSTEAPAKKTVPAGKQVATPGATITPSNRSFPLDSIL